MKNPAGNRRFATRQKYSILTYVTPETHAFLKARADAYGVTVNFMARSILFWWLDTGAQILRVKDSHEKANKTKTRHITIHVTEEVKARVERMGEWFAMSNAQILRLAIAQYLNAAEHRDRMALSRPETALSRVNGVTPG